MELFVTAWIIGIFFTLAAFPISGKLPTRLLLGVLMLLFWPIMLGIMFRNLYLKYINE